MILLRSVSSLAIAFTIVPLTLSAPAHRASDLVGTWRLVSRVVTLADGSVLHDSGLGATPLGMLTYTASGRMSAQLMSMNRPDTVDCSTTSSVSIENNDRSINHYDAYFGTYTVDERAHVVTNHILGALAADDLGKNLTRHFAIAGDTLTISTSTPSPQGTQLKTIKWVRER